MQDRLKQSNEENNVTYIAIHVTLQKYLHLSHFKSNIFCLVHIVLMGDFPFTAHAAIFLILFSVT